MIGYIKGQIIEATEKNIIILAGNVGYKIHTNCYFEKGQDVSVFTYMAVRENSLDLYGFDEKNDLDFFELLLTVSGIGPKSAMSIISNSKPKFIADAIKKEDLNYLTKIAGIGRKNAEKIILELKNKVSSEDIGKSSETETDVLDALLSLGYSEKSIREVLKKIEGKNTEEKIKLALKQLGK